MPSMKILLSSASSTARKIMRGILEKAGTAAADILEAVDRRACIAALTAGVDVAVIDWDLPDLDAAALAGELRSSPKMGKISILFCIKEAQREAAARVAAQGPYDWIERPFTDESFRKKVLALRKPTEKPTERTKPKTKLSTRRLRAIATGTETEFTLPFLLQLPSHLIDELLKRAVKSRHAPGTELLNPGDAVEWLHIVTKGEVEILEGSAGIGTRISGEGDPFGELSFMTAQPSPETVRAHTKIEVASVSKAELAEVLRRHPRMSDYLSSLLSRHSKTMKTRATTLSHADFKGTLDVTPFADLIQLLGSTRKTGVLGFRDKELAGAIYLEDGEAVHAWTEQLKGEDAFFEISSWKSAKFAFRSIRRQEPRTLKTATMTLLLEAMRRLEEGSGAEPGQPLP
jgi:CRP-like cAMP-binding protein